MSKPIATHPDGSNCYTPYCSLREATAREALERDFAVQQPARKQAPLATLEDIAPYADFQREHAEGFIRIQKHPTLPLDIYNYAEITQFQKHWNPVTLACRGLIINRDTHQIVARPFSKFFNHGEVALDEGLVDGPIKVTDKMDGSLGITYPTPGGMALATRGSFQSEQAQHATRLYREKYADAWQPDDNYTYLYEIIYPENRIVVSYQDTDDIVLLGAVNIKTGRSIDADEVPNWPGPRVESFPYANMREVLAAPPRANREGLVAHHLNSDVREKYKQEDYVRLHRIVTGVTPKRIWELMSSHQDIDGWLVDLPDEFGVYVNKERAQLQVSYDAIAADARSTYNTVINELGTAAPRKDYALRFATAVSNKQHTSLMFSLLDDQQEKFDARIWALVEPKEQPNQVTRPDDAA